MQMSRQYLTVVGLAKPFSPIGADCQVAGDMDNILVAALMA
jgi:hypothetical protein